MGHESQIPNDAVNSKEIDSIYKFLAHVDWSEPYLQYLILFHILTFLCVILTRKRVNFQGTLFVILLATIGCSEMINEYMANNHKKFFKQQYFDSYGMFISLVYSAPVLVNCVIILEILSLSKSYIYIHSFHFSFINNLDQLVLLCNQFAC